jgi:hypothetical protein
MCLVFNRRRPIMDAREVVDEDVLLLGDDGKLYHIKPKELEHFEVDSTQPHYAEVMQMLDKGVVAAASKPAPKEETRVLPVLCYLLNLAALRLKEIPPTR